jgi:hypothetical protein
MFRKSVDNVQLSLTFESNIPCNVEPVIKYMLGSLEDRQQSDIVDIQDLSELTIPIQHMPFTSSKTVKNMGLRSKLVTHLGSRQ